MTKHATIRQQQRAIPPIAHLWLNEYGKEQYDGCGAIKVYFDKQSRKKMEQRLGKKFIQQNRKLLTTYRIESTDGQIITVGWLNKRIKK